MSTVSVSRPMMQSLHPGIKKEQVLFVLLSTFRNFAPYFQKGREEDGLSAERSGHFGIKRQHAPS